MFAGISRTEAAWLAVTFAALALVYLPGLDNLPLYDDQILVDGWVFSQYASLAEPKARMLSYGSFVWVRELAGDGWWKQRLVNVAIHMGAVLALWALYREIARHIVPATPEPGEPVRPLAGSAALMLGIAVFALNPVAVYAVAYLIQRSILLASLFTFAALWAFARGLRTGKPAFHVLAVACYALAVMSKEHAILAPLAAVPLYVVVARPSARRLAMLGAAGAMLVGAAAWVLWSRYGEIIGQPFDEFSRVYLAQLEQLRPGARERAYPLSILNQAWLFFEYGVRWMLPASGWLALSLRPAFPVSWASFPHVLGALGYVAVVAAAAWMVLRFRDWKALLGLALLMPALLFATEFATVWVQDPFVLYRSYLWAIGIPGLVLVLFNGPSGRVIAVVGVLVGTLLTWQAFDRVASLANPERAWTDSIAKLSGDARAVGRWFPYINRGSDYTDRDLFNLALRDFERSEQLGDMGMGAFNSGTVLAAMNQHARALDAFDRAARQGYDLYNLPVQRAQSLAALGRGPEAYAELQRAAQRDPPSPTREIVLLRLGTLALQQGKRDEGIAALERLVGLDAAHKEGRYLLAMGYVMRGEHERARTVLETLVRDDPGPRTYYARAVAHFHLKRKAEALADIDSATRLAPNDPMLREWRKRIEAMP